MAKNFCSRAENYSQWYNDIVKKADSAENSSLRGCMVIKPYGYAIWEKMQCQFKDTGHSKATIRCIPFNNPKEEGKCILTGKPSHERVLFARAY